MVRFPRSLARIAPPTAAAFAAVAAVVFTIVVVQWSARVGRLAHEATYDDVVYFLDGLRRVRVFEVHGSAAGLWDLLSTPPHSPLSTLLALGSFALFGVHEAAPYYANGLAVLALLLLSLRAAVPQSRPGTLAVLLATLCIPFSFWAVHEFRPDFFSGLATAASALFAFEATAVTSPARRSRRFALAGLLGAFAIFAKPSFFAHAIVMAAATTAVAWLLLRSHGFSGREIVGPLLSYVASFGVAGGAPLVWNLREIVGYFILNTFGSHSHTFTIKGSFAAVLDYYLIDGAAVSLIGRYGVVFLGAFVVMLPLAWRRSRDGTLLAVSLLAVSGASLAIMLIGRHQSPYFGLPFQLLLWLAFLELASAFARGRLGWLLAATVFLIALVWQGHAPPPQPVFSAPVGLARGTFNHEILTPVSRDAEASHPGDVAWVFITVAGSVNAATLEWMAESRRLPLRFADMHHSSDLGEFRKVFPKSDYIVAPAVDAPGVFEWLPAAAVRAPVLEELSRPPYIILREPSALLPYFIIRNEHVTR